MTSRSVSVNPVFGESVILLGRAIPFVLIPAALAYLGVFLVMPLAVVFFEAFRHGFGAYLEAIRRPIRFRRCA